MSDASAPPEAAGPSGPEPWDGPAFGAAAFQARTGASDAQMADLQAFLTLLAEWNANMNLVGPSALAEFWGRHAYDSAQLLALAPDALTWADLGAGAGFPGLVLAILLKDRPGAQVHLIDSLAKRCRFLSEVVLRLELPARVHNGRAESLSLKVDVVCARALAPMEKLLGYAWPYLKAGAQGLFLKGQDVEVELQATARYWKLDVHLAQSLSHPGGRVVQVKRAVRVPSR
jgi:16S rRNA (guanine527-N7)-methyltransferase